MDVAVAVFAATAAIASTLNLQGAVGEVQGIVLLAAHSCAPRDSVVCLLQLDWVLTPVSFGPEAAPGLYGSFTVVAVIAVLHMLIVSIVKVAQGRLADTLTNQERWDIAAAKTLYPNVSLAVLAFFYQGIIFRTFQNYFDGRAGGLGFGISFVTGAVSLVLAALFIWYWWSRVRIRCEYQPLSEYRRLRPRTCWENNLLIPDGTWTTLPYLFRMGISIFPYKKSRAWFVLVPWVRMFALGFFAASLESACGGMYALGATAFGINVVLTLVLRPYRFGLAMLVSLAVQVTAIIACILGLAQVALPCAMYLGVAVLVACMAIALGVLGFYEQRKYRPEAEALEDARDAPSNPLLGYL